MEKGQFTFQLSSDCEIDIASIDPVAWSSIKKNVKRLLENKQCDDIGKAYICAFLIYIQELDLLIPEYNPEKDNFM
jgi:hypothetical protein